jgi:hypothetical protein
MNIISRLSLSVFGTAILATAVSAQNGPYQHQVHSATSADGLTWTRDAGVRLNHASVPCALNDSNRVLLYYVDADRGPGLPESVGCAVSSNGIDFVKQPFVISGLPTAKAVDPSIVKDASGAYRLYYFGSNAGGDPASETNAHEIHLATSSDGVNFTEANTAFAYPGLVDPDVFPYLGNWFMYVFSLGAGGGTVIATSPNGTNFTYSQILALPGYGTVAPVLLDDGRLRLYAFEQTRPSGNAFRSFISTNGIDWTQEPGDRLLAGTSEQITDPFVIRWQGGWKMYFKSGPAGGGGTNQPPGGNTNITVSFPGRPYRPAVGGTSGFLQTGQEADIMLAGIDFNNTGGPLLFNHPHHVGGDGTRVLLADRDNNRVLVWLAPPGTNTPPNLVLGQPDFTQNNPGTSRAQMNWPTAVSLAPNGRLAIADANNDRLLLWNSFPTSNSTPADLAMVTTGFPNPVPGRPRLSWPWGVWTDGTRLIASATQGGALLFWNSWPASDTTPPSFILTNSAFGTPRAITSDGTFLAVDDHNAILAQPTQPFGHATFFWTNFPATANAPFHFAINGRYRGGMVGPKLVMLGEGRMKIWNGVPTGTNVPPAQDLSGPWGSDGVGLTVAGGRILTVDENSNAILGFSALPANTTGAATPLFAIGSPSPQTNTLLTHYFLQNPCPVSSGSNLFVSSDFHQRLAVWRRLPDQSGAWPDVVYEIPGGGWANTIFSNKLILASVGRVYVWDSLPLNGELPTRTLAGRIGTNNLGSLRGVAMDARFFYLADYDSSRVLVFTGLPATNDNPVAILTPGGRPGRISSDGTWLAVPVEGQGGPHSVKLYRVADLPGSTTPIRSIQAPQAQLNLPGGCTVSHGRLFIGDTSFNRVLVWSNVLDAVNGLTPNIVLGATSLSLADTTPEIGRDKLFMPSALNFDGQYLWVGEFKFSSRLLRYSPSSGASGPMTLTGPLGLGGGSFQARVTGAAGQRFELQSSTNLANWRSDGFRSLPSNSVSLDVSVGVSPSDRKVFLRTRSP